MTDWTSERIASLAKDKLDSLRSNAIRLKKDDVVRLCDEEIARRRPAPKVRRSTDIDRMPRSGQSVLEFHFVCSKEKGTTRNPDGTVWTGTWVVDKKHAEQGAKLGALVALHEAKAEPSYLQGRIVNWRIMNRESEYAEGRPVQREVGVDFCLDLTPIPLSWQGAGSGEKGYLWG